jgi:hypothetical protein
MISSPSTRAASGTSVGICVGLATIVFSGVFDKGGLIREGGAVTAGGPADLQPDREKRRIAQQIHKVLKNRTRFIAFKKTYLQGWHYKLKNGLAQ